MATLAPVAGLLATGEDHDHDHDHDLEYTSAMIYGYGTASVAIISCLAVIGITLFPTFKSRIHEYFVQFFIALGVGTMSADALIHIIPEVLGLHDHGSHAVEGEHDEHDDHEDEETETDHSVLVWKMSVVYAGIFVFFLFENALKVWKSRRRLVPFEGSSEDIIEENKHTSLQTTAFANGRVGKDQMEKSENEGREEAYILSWNAARAGNRVGFFGFGPEALELSSPSPITRAYPEMDSISIKSSNEDTRICWRFTIVMLTVFIGDVLHNVADGMAIRVSFSASATSGIGTSIAVLCHELPHEYGDFAIYLKNGATKWQAIGLNASAAVCAFIGLYVGIAVGQDAAAREWILALVAGMFLYIALVQVMVELVPHRLSSPAVGFGLQIFGLLLGWTLMLLLGLYEEDIESSIG